MTLKGVVWSESVVLDEEDYVFRLSLRGIALGGCASILALVALDARGQSVPAAEASQAVTPAPESTAATPASPSAETAAPCPPVPKSHRELGGHLFLPSHILTDPFSITSFGSYFGVGSGQALAPTINLGPPPSISSTQKWYEYTGIAQQFDLNVRILEFLSARLLGTALAYQGTGNGSALTVGTNAKLTADISVKGSLPLGDHVRLALNVGAAYGPIYNVLIAQGLINAIKSGEIDTSQFFQTSDNITWNATLSGAWGPFPFLGFVVNVEYLNPRKTGNASYSQNGMMFGGDAEFDALPLISWLPLGLNFSYSIISPIGASGTYTTQTEGFGFFYTGRRDLALGLEINWAQGRLDTQLSSQNTIAWVDFRYYW